MHVTAGVLHIDLTVPERVLSLHRADLRVPVERVRVATPVPDIIAQLRGARLPGARVPGRFAIGTWSGERDGVPFHDFVVVHRPGPGVVLGLAGAAYDRILLGDPEPQALIDELF